MVRTLNLTLGRRRNFLKCFLFKRDNKDKNLNELLYKKEYKAIFYARYLNPISKDRDTIGSAFQTTFSNVMLQSSDYLDGIVEVNDLVYFNNEWWVVNNIQKRCRIKESEYCSRPSYFYIIEIRKK